MSDDKRVAFEAWYSNSGKWPQAFRRSGESYVYAECAHAWTVWQAAAAYERQRCAEIAAPERMPYSDDEWRVRCEVRDAILDA